MSEPFIAEVRAFPYTFAPRFWSYCHGSLVPIAQFQTVFAVIGTLYGSDGRVSMGLPDLGQRTPLHFGQGPGLNDYTLAEKWGFNSISLTVDQMPSHDHGRMQGNPEPVASESDKPVNGVSYYSNSASANRFYARPALGPTTIMDVRAITQTGGGQAHENRQPYLALNFFIAMNGIFPS